MKLAKEYNGSYIFSEVVTSLSKEESINQAFFPSIDFLEKKNSIFNGFNNIDFYCMINIQEQGAPVFEKNITLELGLEEHSLFNVMQLISPCHLRLDAEMDKVFSEFHVENKFEPMDMVLINKHIIKDGNNKEVVIQRKITILSNDSKGFPVFGFCAIQLLRDTSTDFDDKNFQLIFTKDKKDLKGKLEENIHTSLLKI